MLCCVVLCRIVLCCVVLCCVVLCCNVMLFYCALYAMLCYVGPISFLLGLNTYLAAKFQKTQTGVSLLFSS